MRETMQNNEGIAQAEDHHEHLEQMHRFSHKTGVITVALIFGIFGLWSIFAELETTISAQGKVITSSYNKTITHPSGGFIKKVFVGEGDHVQKEQPLLQLDNIEEKSKLASHIKKYDKNLLTICRLKAEAELKQELVCDEYQKSIKDDNSSKMLIYDAQKLFESDMKNIQAKRSLLESKNSILLSISSGLADQIVSKKRLLVSFQKELEKWNKLLKADAIDELKAIETQRKIEETNLEIGTLRSKIKENSATIVAHQKENEFEEESFKNKVLTQSNELELENQIIDDTITSLKNTLYNSTIKSPSKGLVTDMKIHTAGEVVSPQKPIMSIVPDEKGLMIEAYVLPTDIEKIYKGQKTEVSFPSFVDPSAVPIEGELIYISADAITLENGKESLYKVLVKITPEGFKAIDRNNFSILPGMPSAVFIQTGKTTLLEYFMHPIIQMFKGIYHAN